MSNPVKAYARNAQRVARLMALLEGALQRHGERASTIAPANLWPMVGSLGYTEDQLKFVLMYLTATTEAEIDNALDEGGSHE
jgi:hypothetical protein